MLKTTIATGALAGVLLMAPPQRPTQAMPTLNLTEVAIENVTEVRRRGFRGGRHFGGRRFRGGRHFGGRRHFRGRGAFHGRRHFRGPRSFGHRRFHRRHFRFGRHYGGRSWGGRSCRWLRFQAIVTGSSYWWSRYNRCRWHRWY